MRRSFTARDKVAELPGKEWISARNDGNVLSIYHVEEGDVGVGFSEADEIFEDTYSSQKIQHAHIEPHAALAYWEPSGKLVIYTSTQNPSSIRAQLAELFDLPQSKVRVIVPYVGGGYGAKTASALGAIDGDPGAQSASTGAVGADAGKRCFLTAHCQAAVVKIKTGVKKDGTIVARQVEAVYDTGAYALTSTNTATKRRGSIGGAVSDRASGFDDVLRVHEHAADGTVSRVWRAAGVLGVRVADGRHRAAVGDRSVGAAA